MTYDEVYVITAESEEEALEAFYEGGAALVERDFSGQTNVEIEEEDAPIRPMAEIPAWAKTSD